MQQNQTRLRQVHMETAWPMTSDKFQWSVHRPHESWTHNLVNVDNKLRWTLVHWSLNVSWAELLDVKLTAQRNTGRTENIKQTTKTYTKLFASKLVEEEVVLMSGLHLNDLGNRRRGRLGTRLVVSAVFQLVHRVQCKLLLSCTVYKRHTPLPRLKSITENYMYFCRVAEEFYASKSTISTPRTPKLFYSSPHPTPRWATLLLTRTSLTWSQCLAVTDLITQTVQCPAYFSPADAPTHK